jgi:putative nucleotidyltransferase with HDIG domain
MNSDNPRSILAQFANQHRPRIVDTLFSQPQLARSTVGIHLRVEELLDAVIQTSMTTDDQTLRRYVETAAARVDEAGTIRAVFADVWESIERIIGTTAVEEAAVLRRQLKVLQLETARVLAQHPIAKQAGTQETFDEVDAAIESLVARLDVTSPFTAEHSRAVSAWSARLARRMSLSETDCNKARRGGLVHDVGKAATPADILDAPRSLTPDEWTIMRSHTTAGAALIEAREILVEMIPAVRHHHERLDGKGYPDGLRAIDIPLIVRIVTVADCFNAMVGRRPYRPPMPPTRALEELSRHRGTQFDPDVVDAMIGIIDG